MTNNAPKAVSKPVDPSAAARPFPDRIVALLVGKALAWLGKRAVDRGDMHDYDHALAALQAGDRSNRCTRDVADTSQGRS